MAMAMSLIQVMAGLVVVVCMPGGTGQQPARRDGHTMPASAQPAPVPMPNAWHAGAGMLGTLPTGPAPATHHAVPLPLTHLRTLVAVWLESINFHHQTCLGLQAGSLVFQQDWNQQLLQALAVAVERVDAMLSTSILVESVL